MDDVITISKTDLVRKARQTLEQARHGCTLIVESYGEEQFAILDIVDYRLLRAAAVHCGSKPRPILTGLSNEQVESAVADRRGDPQVRWSIVVGAYLDEIISLGRTAQLLGLSRFDLWERFQRLGLPLRTGPNSLEEAQNEVETARAWRQEGQSHRR